MERRRLIAVGFTIVLGAGLMAGFRSGTQAQEPRADRAEHEKRLTQRAALASEVELQSLEHHVNKALLREAMMKLGRSELELKIVSGLSRKEAEEAEKRLDVLRQYVEAKRRGLAERGVELHEKKLRLDDLKGRVETRGEAR